MPILFSEYGFERLEDVFLLDDLQFVFLIRGLDAIYHYRRARQWPGFANKEAVEGSVRASPDANADTDYTLAMLAEECAMRGLEPPRHA